MIFLQTILVCFSGGGRPGRDAMENDDENEEHDAQEVGHEGQLDVGDHFENFCSKLP